MKNIMYAALAAVVVLTGCMKNERASTTTPATQTQPDFDRPDDRDHPLPDFSADEHAVQRIRHSLSVDTALPTNGKNIKIIVFNRTLMLRGLVKSEQEKVAIGALARQYAGERNIDNQLRVVK
ncbi:MAG TPA: BON domain-containing protein [Candidatus Limnocylindria bacterium]|nr:BON domain-containing protein [Candidatus Limnocylindria bacterium]